MWVIRSIVAIGAVVAIGCATSEPQVDSAGLVRVSSWKPGNLFAHPTRSIDDYDDILVGDVGLTYAPKQQPLTHEDAQRLKMRVYEIVARQIPAAGQLAVSKPGPCTVNLGVQLQDLEWPTARKSGAATVALEFRDSLSGDPLVRYEQRRELAVAASTASGGPDLSRLGETLEIVAEDVRLRLRDALPLGGHSALADKGCKSVIGQVRKATKEAKQR